jgi:hypothetical protein
VAQFFFEETLAEKNYHNFRLNLLFCWQKLKGIAGFSEMGPLPILGKQQQLSFRSSWVKHCQTLKLTNFLLSTATTQ